MSLRVWAVLSSQVLSDFSILDIGSYHGEFALTARQTNTSSAIIAFEPNPNSLEVLRSNCRSHQITIIEKAISSEIGDVNFRCNGEISAITPSNENDVQTTPCKETITVGAITLDSWAEASSHIPRLIKIDVEDAPNEVLRGAKFVLRNHRPVMICEILNDEIGNKVMESLKGGYEFFYINENWGLEKKNSIKRFDWRYKNWLFVPNEDSSILKLLDLNGIPIWV